MAVTDYHIYTRCDDYQLTGPLQCLTYDDANDVGDRKIAIHPDGTPEGTLYYAPLGLIGETNNNDFVPDYRKTHFKFYYSGIKRRSSSQYYLYGPGNTYSLLQCAEESQEGSESITISTEEDQYIDFPIGVIRVKVTFNGDTANSIICRLGEVHEEQFRIHVEPADDGYICTIGEDLEGILYPMIAYIPTQEETLTVLFEWSDEINKSESSYTIHSVEQADRYEAGEVP